MKNQWLRAGLFLLFLFVASRLVPPDPVDPWGLFRPQKILSMFLALSALQVLGRAFSQFLGHRAGMLMTGFLGGILSSTATTVTLARDSHDTRGSQTMRMAALQSAILAMLLQAVVLIAAGGMQSLNLVLHHFLILFGITFLMIALLWRRHSQKKTAVPVPEHVLDVSATLKLTVFIVLILAASKMVQEWAGSQGVLLLTFVISLFEVHGSLISSSQLFAAGKVTAAQYEEMVEICLLASFVSKFALIFVISNSKFRWRAIVTLLPATVFLGLHLLGWIHF